MNAMDTVAHDARKGLAGLLRALRVCVTTGAPRVNARRKSFRLREPSRRAIHARQSQRLTRR
jgi:hypothetical protein